MTIKYVKMNENYIIDKNGTLSIKFLKIFGNHN